MRVEVEAADGVVEKGRTAQGQEALMAAREDEAAKR